MVPETDSPIIVEPECGDSVRVVPLAQKSVVLGSPLVGVSVSRPAGVVVYVPDSLESHRPTFRCTSNSKNPCNGRP